MTRIGERSHPKQSVACFRDNDGAAEFRARTGTDVHGDRSRGRTSETALYTYSVLGRCVLTLRLLTALPLYMFP